MVKIEDNRTKKMTFVSVEFGNMFEVNGVLYQKINTPVGANANAVRIDNGTCMRFNPTDDVWVAKVTVTING